MSHDFSRRRVSQNWSVKKAVASGTASSFVSEAGRCILRIALHTFLVHFLQLPWQSGKGRHGEVRIFSFLFLTKPEKKTKLRTTRSQFYVRTSTKLFQAFASRITLSPGGCKTHLHHFPLSVTRYHLALWSLQLHLPPNTRCSGQRWSKLPDLPVRRCLHAGVRRTEGCMHLKACKSLPYKPDSSQPLF